MDIAIIGGGAAGMAAAVEAAHNNGNLSIIIFERMDRVGKKLLATGNGRCNYTNMGATEANYYGRDRSFVKAAFERYSVIDNINFFNAMGVFPREEENGKLYPYSGQASAVLDALRNELARLGVETKKSDIAEIVKTKTGFDIIDKDGDIYSCKKVILAAGGCASPSLGSNGSGFKILKAMGHSITELYPALVQLRTPVDEIKALKGIKIEGVLTMVANDKIVGSDKGEILFTDYGISGPPVFQLSTLTARYKQLTAAIDFMPEHSEKAVYDILEGRAKALSHLTMENYFVGLLNKRLGNIIARRAGIEKLSLPVSQLDRALLWGMSGAIKSFKLPVTGTNGFANAQVTAGGAVTDEFDDTTMESKLYGGLYCAGEILDIFGDCGGYNLQWAWSSGRLAGKSAAEAINKQ